MATSGEAYLRYPTVSEETVVFVAEDDLWTVPVGGGRAWRLTAGVAETSNPLFSPDGTQLAFTGREDGPAEVYVMPATGGVARRLTYEAATVCKVAGWDPDGAIVYSSDYGKPNIRGWLRRVNQDGGLSEEIRFGPARSISYGPGGRSVLGRRGSREPAWWKRYRGGTSGELWVDPDGSGEFRVLIELAGNPFDPCWVGDRIYFLSDHEGVGNVYSCTPDGGDLRRHSDHDEYYARNLSTDGRALVYQSAGELYVVEPGAERPRHIEVRLDSSRTQRNRRFVPADENLDSVRLNPEGSGLAITTRGKAFSFGNWEGPIRQHGEPDGTRYRLLSWLPDQQRLIAVAGDESEHEHLVLLTADGTVPPTRLTETDLGRVLTLEVSPVADQIAFTTHDHCLYLLNLSGGAPRQLDHSPYERITDLAWSWDGQWLAYSFGDSAQTTAIKLCRVDSGETTMATRPLLHDTSPAFDPEGRYLYFIGQRYLDPVFDNVQWDAGFPRGDRPYAIALRNDVPSPFAPQPRPVQSEDAEHVRHATEELADDAPPAVTIDLDGIERRVVAFPVDDGRYGRIAGIKGKAIFASYPIEGSRAERWPPPRTPKANASLEVFDFAKQQQERLLDEISDFWVGPDRRTLLYRAGDRLRVLSAGDKPDEESDDIPGRASGWIDLDRVKVSVRPAAEWRQMFREAWRLQRQHFWTEDMSGIDWNRMYQRYLPLVDRITTRSELSDLLWELQGELGTSHAYEMGGEYRSGPDYLQGFLGVDWTYDAERGSYRFDRIPTGDVWDPDTTSPLNRPGTGIRPGDELLAVNGQPVGGQRMNGVAPVTPGERLVNLADQEVELTVRRDDEAPRTVSVRAIADEQPVRYRDWVEANRRTVHEQTDGRVGYIHIPDMGPEGFAEFHRGFLTEYDRDALIVDVRYNRGGSVSGLLLQKLARRRLGYNYPRWSTPVPYPEEAPRGPMVAVTDEWAGSDGDIFSHTFKLMKLGPLIGKRTWGGVIGIWPRHPLADGTVTTQPEYSFAFDDVHWRVENYGTDPDIEVDIAPQDHARGVDPQLDRAISVVLDEIAARPPHRPDPADRPRLTAPPLPPRPSFG